MKILMIGGTGTISTPITKKISKNPNLECYVLNRGNNNNNLPQNIKVILGDINNEAQMKKILENYSFDIVCNFITFMPDQAEKNIRLFKNKTKQFIFVSTAAIYDHQDAVVINEDSKKYNQYSLYGQNKLKCEEIFLRHMKKKDFQLQ